MRALGKQALGANAPLIHHAFNAMSNSTTSSYLCAKSELTDFAMRQKQAVAALWRDIQRGLIGKPA